MDIHLEIYYTFNSSVTIMCSLVLFMDIILYFFSFCVPLFDFPTTHLLPWTLTIITAVHHLVHHHCVFKFLLFP